MIKATAYTNPESIVIDSLRDLAATKTEDGWKVVLRFHDEAEMEVVQNALNYRFPQNMRAMQEMPKEYGYYLTQTGILLYRDGEGDWSIRRPLANVSGFDTEPVDTKWDDGVSASYVNWPHVVATLGAGALPLVPVKFAE